MNSLDKEEKDLQHSYNNEEWESVKNVEEEILEYQKLAAASVKKDKRINIRISGNDLNELKRIALNEGIPYQTFVSSILHKYINGRFIERNVKP